MDTTIKKKALIIDTNLENRQILAFRLEMVGWQILEAGKQEEITNFLNFYPVDLIVTEWSVPGLEGLELMKRLKPREKNIVLFSDAVTEETQTQLTDMGLRAVFPKRKRADMIKQAELILAEEKKGSLPIVEKTVQSKQILLVDDSAAIRLFVRKALEGVLKDCAVREAEDGKSAIAEMSQKKVDVIVTDLEMPGMDGRSFLRLIRKNPVLKQKPMLVLSGSITKDLLDEFKDDAYVAFIPKPSNTEAIQEAVVRLLEGESSKAVKNIN